MIFFYCMSLKYTTQTYSYKNHVFLRLKYMPAQMINLRTTLSPVNYGLKINNMWS